MQRNKISIGAVIATEYVSADSFVGGVVGDVYAARQHKDHFIAGLAHGRTQQGR